VIDTGNECLHTRKPPADPRTWGRPEPYLTKSTSRDVNRNCDNLRLRTDIPTHRYHSEHWLKIMADAKIQYVKTMRDHEW